MMTTHGISNFKLKRMLLGNIFPFLKEHVTESDLLVQPTKEQAAGSDLSVQPVKEQATENDLSLQISERENC